jgi:hypothetical protein
MNRSTTPRAGRAPERAHADRRRDPPSSAGLRFDDHDVDGERSSAAHHPVVHRRR